MRLQTLSTDIGVDKRPPTVATLKIAEVSAQSAVLSPPQTSESAVMQGALMQRQLASPPTGGPCCHLSSVRQQAVLGRLRPALSTSRAAAHARSPTRCAAATLEAPPADAPEADPPAAQTSPAAGDEGEYMPARPPLRTEKKRSRRFKDMQKKVPLKTEALGEALRVYPSPTATPRASSGSIYQQTKTFSDFYHGAPQSARWLLTCRTSLQARATYRVQALRHLSCMQYLAGQQASCTFI